MIRARSLLLVSAALVVGCTASFTPKDSGGDALLADAVEVRPAGGVDPAIERRARLLYLVLAAELTGHRGEVSDSLDFYMEAAELSDNPEVAERAVRIALFSHDYDKARSAVRRWAELAPENVDAHRTLAVLHLRQGELEAAAGELEQVLSLAGQDAEQAYLLVARMLAREEDSSAALRVMGMLVERKPDEPAAAFAHGHLALQFDELDTALASIDRALELRPDWTEASLTRARILVQQGEVDRALGEMEELLDRRGESRDLRLGYARLLIEADRYEEARQQFDSLLKQAPKDADLLYTVSLLALENDDHDRAERYLQRLLKTGTRTSDAHYLLGAVAESREQPEQAMEWYRKVRDGDRVLDAHVRIAALLAKQEKFDEAREHLFQYPATTQDVAVRLIGAEIDILRQAERYEEAMDVASRALERMPEDNDLLYARAMVAEKLGRLDRLERDLKQILERDPDNAHALNALGYTLADRTDRYQEALDYVERALELAPGEAAIVDSMGWVQYRLGNLEEAVRYLRQAWEMNQDAEIAAHYGEVLWVSGERNEARSIWNAGREQDPDNPVLQETVQRLNP